MSVGTRHPTTSARPGEPNDRPPAPAPPPPPRWRRWLLPLGVLTTLVLLSIPPYDGQADGELQLFEVSVRGRFRGRADSFGQPEWCHYGDTQERRQLHQSDPDGNHRHPAGADTEGA